MKKIFAIIIMSLLILSIVPIISAHQDKHYVIKNGKCVRFYQQFRIGTTQVYNTKKECKKVLREQKKAERTLRRIQRFINSRRFDKLYGELDKTMCPLGGSGADACICVYQPVTGYVWTGSHKLEQKIYSNGCYACMNPTTLFYTNP